MHQFTDKLKAHWEHSILNSSYWDCKTWHLFLHLTSCPQLPEVHSSMDAHFYCITLSKPRPDNCDFSLHLFITQILIHWSCYLCHLTCFSHLVSFTLYFTAKPPFHIPLCFLHILFIPLCGLQSPQWIRNYRSCHWGQAGMKHFQTQSSTYKTLL